jgi:DTW domain-containing protein YfiP
VKQSRAHCNQCNFPQSTCLCAFIKPVATRHNIIILQHPSETNHAKGSARLVDLCMTQAVIHVGETAADFAALQTQLADQLQPCYLVYPCKDSVFVETMDQGKQNPPMTLIFLDGNWKKAYKLLQLNPWLSEMPSLSFAQSEKTQYQIRKAPRSDSLSTLESVAYCLDNLDDTDTLALESIFRAMIDNQWRFMSDEVKKRYEDRLN